MYYTCTVNVYYYSFNIIIPTPLDLQINHTYLINSST